MAAVRVALFADSYHEANGVARTAQALEAYARRHNLPLLVVHAGPSTSLTVEGPVKRLALRRGRTSFPLEHDLRFDIALGRYARLVRSAVDEFRPDLVHFMGPSDVGHLGMHLALRSRLPMVGSWHTNLHQYAWRRLAPKLGWCTGRARLIAERSVERMALCISLMYYRLPRAILAPNDELRRLLAARTGKPTFLMYRGVDTDLFSPARRQRSDTVLNIGYVGRLSPEKSVRTLADVAAALEAQGGPRAQFTIVGDGVERAWLQSRLPRATFTGVLRGEALAAAYASMDLFVFPSDTETVGNVVLEAMASGVPTVAIAHGALTALVGGAATLVATRTDLVRAVTDLVHDAHRREDLRGVVRAHAEMLCWDRIFEQVYGVYRLALTEPCATTTGAVVPPTFDEVSGREHAARAAVGGR